MAFFYITDKLAFICNRNSLKLMKECSVCITTLWIALINNLTGQAMWCTARMPYHFKRTVTQDYKYS
jgi:hypothetical protein